MASITTLPKPSRSEGKESAEAAARYRAADTVAAKARAGMAEAIRSPIWPLSIGVIETQHWLSSRRRPSDRLQLIRGLRKDQKGVRNEWVERFQPVAGVP